MADNKVAIITGGSRGIGSAVAIELAQNGFDVVINYAGNEAKAIETQKACENAGVKAITVKADISKADEVEAMIKATTDAFGRIDVLVNNAGITKDCLLMRMSEAYFDDVIDINLKGAFLCMKAVTRIMMKQRYGRVINMSSVVGVYGNAGQMNYAASKAGLIGMTKTMSKEVASRGITVNAIAPGFIKTDMTAELKEDTIATIEKQIPVGRLGEAVDIAKTVSFLASEHAGYITGQVLGVDGGMVL